VESNSDASPLYVSYTSPLSLEKLGIESNGRVQTEPTQGWMVVEVNELFSRCGQYEWLRKEEELEIIGYSLWIYKMDEAISH
jgi:hypothetical protein